MDNMVAMEIAIWLLWRLVDQLREGAVHSTMAEKAPGKSTENSLASEFIVRKSYWGHWSSMGDCGCSKQRHVILCCTPRICFVKVEYSSSHFIVKSLETLS